jgi:hypothetical protein
MSSSRPPPGAGPRAGAPSGAHPRLVADLALPGGRLRVAAGEAVRLPDDPRHLAALLGHDGDRRHHLVLDGRRLDRRGPAARVRAGLVAVGQAPVAADVTVLDHVASTMPRAAARALLTSTPRLAHLIDRPAGVLSGGERRLLAWAQASARTPAVVVLDRAGTGLDAHALDWATDTVGRWRRSGVGLLVRVGRREEQRWLASTVERP